MKKSAVGADTEALELPVQDLNLQPLGQQLSALTMPSQLGKASFCLVVILSHTLIVGFETATAWLTATQSHWPSVKLKCHLLASCKSLSQLAESDFPTIQVSHCLVSKIDWVNDKSLSLLFHLEGSAKNAMHFSFTSSIAFVWGRERGSKNQMTCSKCTHA